MVWLCCTVIFPPILRSDCMSDLAYLKSCLAVKDTAYLQRAYYRYTQSGRIETRKMIARIPQFETEIDRALSEHEVPEWVKYLPMAESRLQPKALSPAGAVGLWQIMPATGRGLGLKINSRIDERLHTTKASQAAAKYLKQLHGQFGDWLLALAAYNCGAGNVRKAQRRANGYFYHEISRYLPRQTRRYIPRVLTIATIAQNPDLHGFPSNSPTPQRLISFSCKRTTDLKELASYFSCPMPVLEQFNPAFLDGKLLAHSGSTSTFYIPEAIANSGRRNPLMQIANQIKRLDQLEVYSIYPMADPSPIFAAVAQKGKTWDWLLAFKLVTSPPIANIG